MPDAPRRGEVWWVAFDPRKARADQIFTASKLRLKGRIGLLSRADLAAVERVVRVQLGL